MKGFWEKIEKISLFLWLLLIPTQLGKHFWPDWGFVMGVRSDYLGPILYLNDLVWLVWIISKILGGHSGPHLQKIKKLLNFENFLLVVFVGLNVLVAGNKWVAIYRWGRIIQGGVTIYNLKFKIYNLKKYLVWVIPCWIVIESLLGLGQFTKGGSLQGIWYWLGERRFTLTTIGIAQMSVFGEGLVRAYGTFSHPNSMAGFLLVSWMLWKTISPNPLFDTRGLKIKRIFYWVVTWLAVIGIVISGSRTVWGLGVIVTIFNLQSFPQGDSLRRANFKLRKKIGLCVIGLGVVIMILAMVGMNYRTGDFVGGWDNDSLVKRINLNVLAIKMWKDNYVLGVGMGNFVAKLPEYQADSRFYWLQPVHNIFLLLGSELGVLGVMLVIYKLQFLIFSKNTKKYWIILGIVVITGMMDHYWITLPQNWNLMMVVLSLL